MLHLNITLLLIISLPIFTITSTLYKEVKKYIVVNTKHIKTRTLKRKAPVPSHFTGGEHWEGKNCNDETYNSLLLKHFM